MQLIEYSSSNKEKIPRLISNDLRTIPNSNLIHAYIRVGPISYLTKWLLEPSSNYQSGRDIVQSNNTYPS